MILDRSTKDMFKNIIDAKQRAENEVNLARAALQRAQEKAREADKNLAEAMKFQCVNELMTDFGRYHVDPAHPTATVYTLTDRVASL